MIEERWVYRNGSLATGEWDVVVDRTVPGWEHTGLRVATLNDSSVRVEDPSLERMIVPLSGSFTVTVTNETGSEEHPLRGRRSVFDGATDVLYVGIGNEAVIHGHGASRVAVAEAPATAVWPSRVIRADSVPTEIRGGGPATRAVRNFGTPGNLDADRLIVCEVITPSGNWSSYPPHKHDEERDGQESALEEIYYFETASEGRQGPVNGGFGYFSASSSAAGEIEIDTRVAAGDVVLIPFGYHGPAAAPPGYDLYYLNVMAGPGPRREWLIHDDPRYTWVRDGWAEQGHDARLVARGEGHDHE